MVEKAFSSQDDSFEFFQSGWMTVNSKFGANSLRLIEDESYSTGAGMVRTPSFDAIKKGEVTIVFQPTGFNNVQNREVFIDKTFSFAVDFLLKEEDEYVVKNTQSYEHKITKDDADLGYFVGLNPYATDKDSANEMKFSFEGDFFNCIRIRYLSKPNYINGSTKQGINLEIFYLGVKTKSA